MGYSGMGFWDQVIMVGMLAFFSYFIIGNLRRNPQSLSLNNLNKSFRFMGLLAVILIGFVSFLVLMLPSSGKAVSPDKEAQMTQSSSSAESSPSRPQRSL